MILNKEELYRSVVEHTPDLISRWNADLKLIYANPAYEKKAGVPYEFLYGKNSTEMGHPDDIARPWMESLRKVFETGKPVEHYDSFPTPLGIAYFHSRIVPEKNDKGRVETVLAIGRDITELETADRQLRQQSHYLQRIQETVPDMISVMELATGKFEYLNKEAFTEQGFNITWLKAKSPEELNEIIHAEDRGTVAHYLQQYSTAADQDIITAEYRARDDKGQWKWFLVRGRVFQRNHAGMATHVLNVVKNITERKISEQELRESKRLLQSVFNAVPGSIAVFKIIYDGESKVEDFEFFMLNDFTFKNGPGTAGIIGKRYSEVFPAVKTNGVLQKFRETVDTNKPVRFEMYYSGDDINNWLSFSAVKMEDLLIVTTDDTTERRAAEDKIKEDTHFIGQLMDTTPDIIYIMDLNKGQLIYCNRQVAADLGYSHAQIAAMRNPVFDIMHEEDIPLMIDHLKTMKHVWQDDKIVEVEYRLIDARGAINWFRDRNVIFKRIRGKIPVEKIGISQNITEEKLQQERIVTNLDIIAQAEEIAQMGSWEYDIPAASFKWSDGMYRLFNLPTNQRVTPEIYLDYTREEEHAVVRNIVNNIRYEFAPFEEIVTLLPTGQPKKVVKIKGVVIKDKKKVPVKIVGVDLDITHQLKAADEINQLNRILLTKNRDLETLNDELRTFNTIAANDYKETIQVLYTNLEYIISRDGRVLSDTSKANIRRAQSAIQRMKLLTDDINTYLQLYDTPVYKMVIDPNIIVSEVISKWNGKIEQAGATVEVNELPTLYADPILFSTLVGHLLDNSIKFRRLARPAMIKIKYSQADEMNAIPEAIHDMPYTIISISDNGIGFEEENAEKIFEMFARLHDNKGTYKGSGIGLAACKKIMTLHNGFITAESKLATGSTFNCYFPREAG